MNNKAKRHTLDWLECEKELRMNPHKSRLAGSYGEGADKTLYVVTAYDLPNVRVHFTVEDRGATVYVGGDLREAIDRYNAAP